jgi:hypothetical protein
MLLCLASLLIAGSQADSVSICLITQLVHTRWTTKEGAPTDDGDGCRHDRRPKRGSATGSGSEIPVDSTSQ